ncbi:DNA-binding response regulator [Enterobacter asburiae]|jgi:DNA-binding NarL/FixJ family response regulator|uniref:LuxR C-terminal-related transcriptional regulator n=3 Tax=Enterobacter asburiae TaxID=61645 RepID=A0ABU6KPE0_ENTAS|nr:LuxR C-terminal-related transcriptional regulator [Enterobacter asburiae]CAE7777996.1 hypothetical protein AI2797V1_1053 [Enterobacter cloacae]MEC5727803.1 LuxR C-terminal-related transcriptional regulator [Enterobacter asburiae]RWT08787.1 DNA-binding response regulator [Enterobacter asburiae]CAE7797812.1 hypothetical protein AI2802V1_1052 [Enterobacter cloacae]CAH3561580.1 hypothetical protein AI2797V1_1053 [Enterobacter cloacae]
MSPGLKTNSVIIFEPRQLFYQAASSCMEACGCQVENIFSDGVMRELVTDRDLNVLTAIGLNGAGAEFYPLLKIINLKTKSMVNLVVWLPERDIILANFMRALGVTSLLSETYLIEEIPLRLDNMFFNTSYFPVRHMSAITGGIKSRVSRTELDIVIDCACGMDPYEIARKHDITYKTVLAHIYNIRVRLNLEDRNRWFDLLTRMKQISSTK